MADQDRFYSEFLKTLHFFIDKIADGYLRKQEVFDYASNLPVEDIPGVVVNAYPGALFIKCEGQQSEQVPSSAYNRNFKFEKDMKIIVSKKGGTIIQVIPKEKDEE